MFESLRPSRRTGTGQPALVPKSGTRPTWAQRRVVGAALLVFLLAVLLGIGIPRLQRWMDERTPLPVGGRLLLPSEAGLVLFQLDDREQQVLVRAGSGEMVTAAAWSPDASAVAYSLFHRRPEDSATVSEIFMADVSGGQIRPLAERQRPGDQLDSPAWSPDGRAVYFSTFSLNGGQTVQRIERVTVATGERTAILEGGYAPAVSPDGRLLAYLRDSRVGSGLWVRRLDDGDVRALIPEGQYPALAAPRFSPDGRWLAVAIVNGANTANRPPGLLGWLVPTAYAHGQPWDIWLVDVAGGSARRLTYVNADDPAPAWSPDGDFVAFWGGNGLFLADVRSGRVRQVLDRGSYGPIDWAR